MLPASLHPSLQKNLIKDQFGIEGYFLFLRAYMTKKKMKLLCNQTAFLIWGGHIQAFTGLIKTVIKTRKLKCEASIKKQNKTRFIKYRVVSDWWKRNATPNVSKSV